MNQVPLWLQSAYYASGPLLVLLGSFGLIQLKLAKDDMTIRTTRDAKHLALELLERLDQTVELHDAAWTGLQKGCVPLPSDHWIHDLTDSRIASDESIAEFEGWVRCCFDPKDPDHTDAISNVVRLLNYYSAFARGFECGMADVDVGYEFAAEFFVSSLRRFGTILVFLSEAPPGGRYDDLLSLYNEWVQRLALKDLTAQMDSLRRRAKT